MKENDLHWEFAKVHKFMAIIKNNQRLFYMKIKIVPLPEHKRNRFHQVAFSNKGHRYMTFKVYEIYMAVFRMRQYMTNECVAAMTNMQEGGCYNR